MRVSQVLKKIVHLTANTEEAARRCLKVAVIGPPNVGKSLLTNKLVKAGVAAVSAQMDTTQKNQTAVITEGTSQLVFVDSPGTVGIKHAREVIKNPSGRILSDPEMAVEQADHILVVHDATMSTDYILHRVLHILHRHRHIPSSLVLNKVDLVTHRADLLALTRVLCNGIVDNNRISISKKSVGKLQKLCGKAFRAPEPIPLHTEEEKMQDMNWKAKYQQLLNKPTHKCGWSETKFLYADIKGWSYFKSVFFVSALTGEGIKALREYLYDSGQRKGHTFDREVLTTKHPQIICRDAVRAELLNHVPPYIAYTLKVRIREWQMNGEVLQIVVDVNCEKERMARIIVGSHGLTISEIGKSVNETMQNLLGQQLFIRILVKVDGKLYEVPSAQELLTRKRLEID